MQSRIERTPKVPAKRIIRDEAFGHRLEQACNNHNLVPAKHDGRLGWIQQELAEKFNEDVSVETVRKWFAGEARPRPSKVAKIAELLQVDLAWLSLGIDSHMLPRERRARNAMADGAVNLVAGLIQMDGGSPAFPEVADGDVDLHAVIKGAKYDFHVSLGENDGQQFHFSVPSVHESVFVLGVIRNGFSAEVMELSSEIIRDAGIRHGGSIEVVVNHDRLQRIDSFARRL